MCSHDTTDVMPFGAVALLSLSLQCLCASHAGAAFVATFNCNALWALLTVMTLSINDPSPAYFTVNLAHIVQSIQRLHSTPTPTALLPFRAVVQ